MSKRRALIVTGLLALAACTEPPAEPPAGGPGYRPPTAEEQDCVNRGFMRGSEGYLTCMQQHRQRVRELPPLVVAPPPGVETTRDEYGHRYDGLGNPLP